MASSPFVVPAQTPIWRRAVPDAYVWDYMMATAIWTPGVSEPLESKELARCNKVRNTLQVDLSALFWTTQSKTQRIHFRSQEPDRGNEFSYARPHFLCFKCGKWIPDTMLARHLPLRELQGYGASNSALCHSIPDSTEVRRISFNFQNSRSECNHWYLYHLEQPDWPSFCPKCNCVVMHSALHLRRSDQVFCRHAKLATAVALGALSTTRFSHYPGHPRAHLFRVGRWHILALLRLKHAEMSFCNMLFRDLRRLLALSHLVYP